MQCIFSSKASFYGIPSDHRRITHPGHHLSHKKLLVAKIVRKTLGMSSRHWQLTAQVEMAVSSPALGALFG